MGNGSTARDGDENDDALLLGRSEPMVDLRRTLQRLAPVRAAVLLRGESGTGKELAALALHDRSGRSGRFVAVNCGAVAESLAGSLLFGHVRGAFTGALADRAGAFERADGGTLFLDEIGELPLPQQALLLRTLETRCVLPLGAERERQVDARLVAATHRDLERLVACGRFREDLYHRIRVLELTMPPLRARPGDVPLLLEHFAAGVSAELGRPVQLTAAAVESASLHPWPGNVRALKHALLRAAATTDGPIDAGQLLAAVAPRPRAAQAAAQRSVLIPRGDYRSMNNALLRHAVSEHGSIRRAAKALGIPRSTLGAWLRRGE